MSDTDFQEPEQVVVAFIEAMHAWEVDAYGRFKASVFEEKDHTKMLAASEQASEERRSIVAQFCSTTKRYPAPFGYPPQYDPVHKRVVEIRKRSSQRVEVLTEYLYPEQYINEQRRYKLMRTPDGWKIDDRTTESNKRWFSSI